MDKEQVKELTKISIAKLNASMAKLAASDFPDFEKGVITSAVQSLFDPKVSEAQMIHKANTLIKKLKNAV
ncbi:MAG: hypothetical protein ACI9N9_000105 [Enterobacterales bacterium]|jgi:hypothetical protein